ncbi:GAF and ANTAR domain-containing protein [Streptomyces venezuelae]
MDEGPCLFALRTGIMQIIEDTQGEQRFGSFPARAQTHGIRSTLALPLVPPGQHTTGVMNLYARRPSSFPPQVRDQVAVFAGYAAGALGVAQKIAHHTQFSEDLQTALASRSVIDQALGIIMAQQRCPAQRAFQMLSRASQNRNMKLRDVAADIITNVTGTPPASPQPLQPRTHPGQEQGPT